MNQRGELLVFKLGSKVVAYSSAKAYETLELSKEKTVPKEEKGLEEESSKHLSRFNMVITCRYVLLRSASLAPGIYRTTHTSPPLLFAFITTMAY